VERGANVGIEQFNTLYYERQSTTTHWRISGVKPARNERCSCGSGKKFKHCCAGKAPPLPAAAVNALKALAGARHYADMEIMADGLLLTYPLAGFLWKALSVARQLQNKDAFNALQKAAELLPDDPEVQSNLGAAWRRLGRLDEAVACYRRALEVRPDVAEVWNNLGNAQRDLGQLDDARAAYRRALELKPEMSKAHNGLGNVLQDLGHLDEAAASYRRAVELDPGNAEAHTNLGITLRLQSLTTDAQAACRRALELEPNNTGALILLAELYSDHGEFEEAEQLLRRASAVEPGSSEAWAGIAGLRRMTRADADWLTEAQRIVDSGLAQRREMPLRYALGKYFDDVGDYARAFENYRRANTLAKQSRPAHDRTQVAVGIERLMKTYDADWIRRPRTGANPSERPVFIVGMPRSGTTLAEQILAAHGAVFGAGELPFWNTVLAPYTAAGGSELEPNRLQALAGEYVAMVTDLAPDASRVIDKMPGNFVYLGLIHAALPQAKFLHLKRDPVDTCLSIYFQNFGAFHTYANDLDDLAQYYAEYLKVMAHWRRTLPPGVLLEVDYEELVADPQAVSRLMVEFLGLSWDPNGLDVERRSRTVSTFSKWQARQSIHTQSVARWRHYEEFLGPLRRLMPEATAPVAIRRTGTEPDASRNAIGLAEMLTHAKASHSAGRFAEAEHGYRQLLDADPSNFEAAHQLGILALQTARPDLAIRMLREAVALDPRHVHANANLGTAYLVANRLEEALSAYDRTLELDPRLAGGWRNRGTILQRLDRQDEAADSFQRCWELAPEFDFALGSMAEARRYACNWRNYQQTTTAILNSVKAGRNVDRPFSFLSVTDSAKLQRQCATSHVAYLCPRELPPLWRGERYLHPKIRVAYVSADFRAHVVMDLMAPIFEAHDRQRFHLIGVALIADDHSEILNRAKRALDQFIDASMLSDAAAAQAVRDAEADIVVDLTGYTAGCRAPIFARRPAPVQVSYLGYAGTSGAPYFDYLIADAVTVPPAHEPGYSEHIVRLPGCFLPTDHRTPDDRHAFDGPRPSRRDLGLPDRGFVFCAFSSTYKFNPTTFAIWMRLLEEIPDSVLWLRDAGPVVRGHLEREAIARGVEPERLVFAGRVVAKKDHVARQACADLFLDTFPYGAHATARDALWAGLPVLTCLGESFASRVAGSLLTSLELPELVAHSLDDYAARALELARNPDTLAALRSRLAERLHDRVRYGVTRLCAHLEAAYQTMWSRAQRGEQPSTFDV